jgi:hypothetical protein
VGLARLHAAQLHLGEILLEQADVPERLQKSIDFSGRRQAARKTGHGAQTQRFLGPASLVLLAALFQFAEALRMLGQGLMSLAWCTLHAVHDCLGYKRRIGHGRLGTLPPENWHVPSV